MRNRHRRAVAPPHRRRSRRLSLAAGWTAATAFALTPSALAACSAPDVGPIVATTPPARVASIAPSGAPSGWGTETRTANALAASTFVIECVDSNLQREPRSFTLTCADANSILDSLTWSHWGEPVAHASGELAENTCEPTCVAGTVLRYPVVVEARKAVARPDAQIYTELKVTLTRVIPKGWDAVTIYPLPH